MSTHLSVTTLPAELHSSFHQKGPLPVLGLCLCVCNHRGSSRLAFNLVRMKVYMKCYCQDSPQDTWLLDPVTSFTIFLGLLCDFGAIDIFLLFSITILSKMHSFWKWIRILKLGRMWSKFLVQIHTHKKARSSANLIQKT